MDLTNIQKSNLRLKSMEIAIVNGTKAGMEKDACLGMAEKIYKFAIGTTDKAPKAGKKVTG